MQTFGLAHRALALVLGARWFRDFNFGAPELKFLADCGQGAMAFFGAAITITATARVETIRWDMGDGTKITCRNKGTAYKAAFGKSKSPTCGHTYETSSGGLPDDRFTVTATSEWVVSWEGAGQSGVIRLDGLQRSVRVAVGEAQVLVQ